MKNHLDQYDSCDANQNKIEIFVIKKIFNLEYCSFQHFFYLYLSKKPWDFKNFDSRDINTKDFMSELEISCQSF